jgi:hypothetical protein
MRPEEAGRHPLLEGMENPTSVGMRSGSLAQAMMRKLSMSTPSLDHGAKLNMRQDESRTA